MLDLLSSHILLIISTYLNPKDIKSLAQYSYKFHNAYYSKYQKTGTQILLVPQSLISHAHRLQDYHKNSLFQDVISLETFFNLESNAKDHEAWLFNPTIVQRIIFSEWCDNVWSNWMFKLKANLLDILKPLDKKNEEKSIEFSSDIYKLLMYLGLMSIYPNVKEVVVRCDDIKNVYPMPYPYLVKLPSELESSQPCYHILPSSCSFSTSDSNPIPKSKNNLSTVLGDCSLFKKQYHEIDIYNDQIFYPIIDSIRKLHIRSEMILDVDNVENNNNNENDYENALTDRLVTFSAMKDDAIAIAKHGYPKFKLPRLSLNISDINLFFDFATSSAFFSRSITSLKLSLANKYNYKAKDAISYQTIKACFQQLYSLKQLSVYSFFTSRSIPLKIRQNIAVCLQYIRNLEIYESFEDSSTWSKVLHKMTKRFPSPKVKWILHLVIGDMYLFDFPRKDSNKTLTKEEEEELDNDLILLPHVHRLEFHCGNEYMTPSDIEYCPLFSKESNIYVYLHALYFPKVKSLAYHGPPIYKMDGIGLVSNSIISPVNTLSVVLNGTPDAYGFLKRLPQYAENLKVLKVSWAGSLYMNNTMENYYKRIYEVYHIVNQSEKLTDYLLDRDVLATQSGTSLVWFTFEVFKRLNFDFSKLDADGIPLTLITGMLFYPEIVLASSETVTAAKTSSIYNKFSQILDLNWVIQRDTYLKKLLLSSEGLKNSNLNFYTLPKQFKESFENEGLQSTGYPKYIEFIPEAFKNLKFDISDDYYELVDYSETQERVFNTIDLCDSPPSSELEELYIESNDDKQSKKRPLSECTSDTCTVIDNDHSTIDSDKNMNWTSNYLPVESLLSLKCIPLETLDFHRLLALHEVLFKTVAAFQNLEYLDIGNSLFALESPRLNYIAKGISMPRVFESARKVDKNIDGWNPYPIKPESKLEKYFSTKDLNMKSNNVNQQRVVTAPYINRDRRNLIFEEGQFFGSKNIPPLMQLYLAYEDFPESLKDLIIDTEGKKLERFFSSSLMNETARMAARQEIHRETKALKDSLIREYYQTEALVLGEHYSSDSDEQIPFFSMVSKKKWRKKRKNLEESICLKYQAFMMQKSKYKLQLHGESIQKKQPGNPWSYLRVYNNPQKKVNNDEEEGEVRELAVTRNKKICPKLKQIRFFDIYGDLFLAKYHDSGCNGKRKTKETEAVSKCTVNNNYNNNIAVTNEKPLQFDKTTKKMLSQNHLNKKRKLVHITGDFHNNESNKRLDGPVAAKSVEIISNSNNNNENTQKTPGLLASPIFTAPTIKTRSSFNNYNSDEDDFVENMDNNNSDGNYKPTPQITGFDQDQGLDRLVDYYDNHDLSHHIHHKLLPDTIQGYPFENIYLGNKYERILNVETCRKAFPSSQQEPEENKKKKKSFKNIILEDIIPYKEGSKICPECFVDESNTTTREIQKDEKIFLPALRQDELFSIDDVTFQVKDFKGWI